MQVAAPDPRERREIERQIARDQPIEDALAAASAALSGLSQAAGVVLAPKSEMRLKQLGLVPLGPDRALAVLVGADGSDREPHRPARRAGQRRSAQRGHQFHQRASVRTDARRGAGATARAKSATGGGARPGGGGADRIGSGGVERGPCAAAGADRPRAGEPHRRQRRGRSRTGPAACSRSSRTGRKSHGCSKKRATLRDAGFSSAARTGCSRLSGSSVIAAPYRGSQGDVVGVVGVIGPTRLNYARVIPMVDFTAKALTRLMA